MNEHSSIRASGSLLERAAEKFDFGAALRGAAQEPAVPAGAPARVMPVEPLAPPPAEAAPRAAEPAVAPSVAAPVPAPVEAPRPAHNGHEAVVDRASLAEAGFILPDMRPGALAEEFRIVKRQLLLRAAGQGGQPIENGRMILVCSAKPDEGKTFCAINLALSMARETDLDVVLADCDFNKPEIVEILGIEDGPGLMDALADRTIDAESCVIRTDIPNLSVLPAGRHSDDAPELLASQRTREVFDGLLARDPARILIVDSPPALSASPASILAMHAGQTMMVVKADATNEAELREALGLLDGCKHIQLLLNAVTFSPNGKRFGDYYGYGE